MSNPFQFVDTFHEIRDSIRKGKKFRLKPVRFRSRINWSIPNRLQINKSIPDRLQFNRFEEKHYHHDEDLEELEQVREMEGQKESRRKKERKKERRYRKGILTSFLGC